MKSAIWILCFFVLISSAYAEKVYIFDFNYDNGIITLNGQTIKEGYYPDRNIQPENGYKCGLYDTGNKDLYNFKFELPLTVYTDVIKNSNVDGQIIFLNETDFSFIMPYKDKSANLVCYNPKGYEILRQETSHVVLSPEGPTTFLMVYGAAALAVLIILIFWMRKKK